MKLFYADSSIRKEPQAQIPSSIMQKMAAYTTKIAQAYSLFVFG